MKRFILFVAIIGSCFSYAFSAGQRGSTGISRVATGGVSQIAPGTNITISPGNGVGVVTVNGVAVTSSTLASGSTNYIQVSSTSQNGAVMFVPSGTVTNLTVSTGFLNNLTVNTTGTFYKMSFTSEATGVDPTLDQGLATKNYVDGAVAGSAGLELFFSTGVSDIIGYFVMTSTLPGNSKSTQSYTTTATGQTISTFTTINNQPGLNSISAGIYEITLRAKQTLGTVTATYLYAELWKRSNTGTETILQTSENSPFIGVTETAFSIHFSTNYDISLSTSDRIVLRVKANLVGVIVFPTIEIYVDGNTASHLEIDVPQGNYVNRNGDTMTGSLTTPNLIVQSTITLPASGVTAGYYTNSNIVVGSNGLVTSAANGTAGGGAKTSNRASIVIGTSTTGTINYNVDIASNTDYAFTTAVASLAAFGGDIYGRSGLYTALKKIEIPANINLYMEKGSTLTQSGNIDVISVSGTVRDLNIQPSGSWAGTSYVMINGSGTVTNLTMNGGSLGTLTVAAAPISKAVVRLQGFNSKLNGLTFLNSTPGGGCGASQLIFMGTCSYCEVTDGVADGATLTNQVWINISGANYYTVRNMKGEGAPLGETIYENFGTGGTNSFGRIKDVNLNSNGATCDSNSLGVIDVFNSSFTHVTRCSGYSNVQTSDFISVQGSTGAVIEFNQVYGGNTGLRISGAPANLFYHGNTVDFSLNPIFNGGSPTNFIRRDNRANGTLTAEP